MKKRDYEKLLDDLKITSKVLKIIKEENNPDNRKFACGLAEDMINRIFRDVKMVYDANHEEGDNSTDGGSLEDN